MTLAKLEKRPHSLYVPSMGSGSGYSWRHFSSYVRRAQLEPRRTNGGVKTDTTEESETPELCEKWGFLFADRLRAAANPSFESRKGPPPQMPKLVVVMGMQSGDEGVEMLMQELAKDADVVCKSQGAGQRVNQSTDDCNLIPSGIMNPKCKCLLGNGMAVDVLKILEEGRLLESKGVKDWKSRLIISDRAHVICPTPNNSATDVIVNDEESAFVAKAGRVGLRAGDLLDRESALSVKVSRVLNSHRNNNVEVPIDEIATLSWWRAVKDSGITSSIRDSMLFLEQSLMNPNVNSILVEGVEPNLRDVDFGSYPIVSSVNSSVGGVFTGLGVSLTGLKAVYGVFKSFVTRRDGGPFPTEIIEDNYLFKNKTNSKMRVGWLDIPMLRHAQQINGFNALSITNLEALDDLEEISVATEYSLNGKTLKGYPASFEDMRKVKVAYQEYPGWKTSLKDCKSYDDLPQEARHFVEELEKLVGSRIQWVGVDANQSKLLSRA